jgi:hypothetical protein
MQSKFSEAYDESVEQYVGTHFRKVESKADIDAFMADKKQKFIYFYRGNANVTASVVSLMD